MNNLHNNVVDLMSDPAACRKQKEIERVAAYALAEAGLLVIVVTRVRYGDLAGDGTLAKSNRLDAEGITLFARSV